MSTLDFLLNYIEMKCSDMPKIQKTFYSETAGVTQNTFLNSNSVWDFHLMTTSPHLAGMLAPAIIPSLRLDTD